MSRKKSNVPRFVDGSRVTSPTGLICIEPEGYATDDALASWVQRGLDFVIHATGRSM